MMLSVREFNTPYKGSMNEYIRRTNDTMMEEEYEVDDAAIQLQFPETKSQFVKQGDLNKPNQSSKLRQSAEQQHYDDPHRPNQSSKLRQSAEQQRYDDLHRPNQSSKLRQSAERQHYDDHYEEQQQHYNNQQHHHVDHDEYEEEPEYYEQYA
jgi:hypothetical protein